MDLFVLLASATTEEAKFKIQSPVFELPLNWQNDLCKKGLQFEIVFKEIRRQLNHPNRKEETECDIFYRFIRNYLCRFFDNWDGDLITTFGHSREGFWIYIQQHMPGEDLLLALLIANEEVLRTAN